MRGAAPHGLPRRLGIVVEPAPGESLPSWIDRLAVRLSVPVGLVVRELRLEQTPAPVLGSTEIVPLHWGITLTARDRLAIQAATGVPPARLDSMCLSVFDGTVLDLAGLTPSYGGGLVVKGREWALFRGSRCCPACLAESGGVWQLWWKLGVAAACPRHRVMLADSCPACGTPIRKGHRASLPTTSPTSPDAAVACRGKVTRGRNTGLCGALLTGIARREAPQRLLDAQQPYLEAAAGEQGALAGRRVPAAEWFAVFRGLASLTRRVAPLKVMPLGGAPGSAVQAWEAENAACPGAPNQRWRSVPDSADLAAALLCMTYPAMSAGSEAGFLAEVAPLVKALDEQRTHPNASPRPRQMPALLRQALLQAPSRRAGPAQPRMWLYPEPRLIRAGMSAAHVPQHPRQDDVAGLVRPWLGGGGAGRGPDRHVPQRIAALGLAMLVTSGGGKSRGWSMAAELLDFASRDVPAAVERVLDPEMFRTGLCEIADRLIARGLVDYRLRRAALRDLAAIPEEAWSTRPYPCRPAVTGRVRYLAAAWLWAELTSGYHRDAPGYRAMPRFGVSKPSVIYHNWKNTVTPEFAAWLREWGQDYLRARGAW